MTSKASERRSLRYIRLAAYLAGQPGSVTRVELPVSEIEAVVGRALPSGARFPSWWRNDTHRMHSRAWLTAGWQVEQVRGDETVVFVRNHPAPE